MPDNEPTLQRTEEEVQATIAKLQAEARKANAEAQRAEAEAQGGELLLAQAREQHARSLVTDDHKRVYRFISQVSKQSVQDCIEHLHMWSRLDPQCDIEIIFSSPGGSVFDGFVLFDEIQMLRAGGHKITTGTVGMAASMAGVLLQAGDHRWMGNNALILIHRTELGSVGKAYEIEDEMKLVQRLEKRIMDIFVERTGGKLSRQKITKNWERKDWWIEAEEALELGLIDEVRTATAV